MLPEINLRTAKQVRRGQDGGMGTPTIKQNCALNAFFSAKAAAVTLLPETCSRSTETCGFSLSACAAQVSLAHSSIRNGDHSFCLM